MLRLDVPLLVGEAIVAPGTYRVGFERSAETKAAITVAGSGLGLLTTGDGRIDGELGKAAKPAKKLDIQWRKKGTAPAGAAVAANQPVQIVVTFGPDEWVGDAVVLGHKPFTVAGWKGALFQVPSARLEAGLPTPIASLTRGNDHWNVVVDKDGVRVVPWMEAPTEQFGFGAVPKPDPARVVTGTRETIKMKVATPKEVADLVSAKKEKGDLRLEIVFGQEGAVFVLPEPKAKS
jgi:hypothetical protein